MRFTVPEITHRRVLVQYHDEDMARRGRPVPMTPREFMELVRDGAYLPAMAHELRRLRVRNDTLLRMLGRRDSLWDGYPLSQRRRIREQLEAPDQGSRL